MVLDFCVWPLMVKEFNNCLRKYYPIGLKINDSQKAIVDLLCSDEVIPASSVVEAAHISLIKRCHMFIQSKGGPIGL